MALEKDEKAALNKPSRKGMIEHVVPLKDSEEVDRVEQALLNQGKHNPRQTKVSLVGVRNMMLFEVGIFTGLRVSDIITLKVSDVKKSDLVIRERKTGKMSRTHISPELRSELDDYIKQLDLKDDDWLFPSTRDPRSHVSRPQVWRAIHNAGLACGMPNLGSHTMRKTFGRLWYEDGGSIVTLQAIYNHVSQAVTMRYIGIEQVEINKQLDDFHPHSVKPKRK